MNLTALLVDTIRNPSETARRILALNLDRAIVFQGLLLVAAIAALISGLSVMSVTPAPDAPAPNLLAQPIGGFMLVALGCFASSHIFTWVGRSMGGTGTFDDVFVLFVWLQAVQVALHLLTVVVGSLAPTLAPMVVFATFVIGFWLTVHFLNEAMRFGSLAKSFGSLALTVVGLVVVLTVMITLFGGV